MTERLNSLNMLYNYFLQFHEKKVTMLMEKLAKHI